MARFLFVCNTDGALYKFRFPILKYLIQSGHQVFSITTPFSPEGSYIDLLNALGVKTYTVDFAPKDLSLLNNLKLINRVRSIVKNIDPQYVHCFTHKGNIIGGLGTALSGVKNKKIFLTMTGLGASYGNKGIRGKIFRLIIGTLYKILDPFSSAVFFQNSDDREIFKNTFKRARAVITPGSGLDPSSVPALDTEKIEFIKKEMLQGIDGSSGKRCIICLMPSRALFQKGISEFYAAADICTKLREDLVFIHAGSAVDTPALGLSEYELLKKNSSRVKYIGYKSDIFHYLAASDVIVLPSFYREGVPRSLIEALFLGKYIITTKSVGCKDTVIDGWNGQTISTKSINDLVSAFMTLDENKISVKKRSCSLFEKKFHADIVVSLTAKEYFSLK